jgi:hypothetical protein
VPMADFLSLSRARALATILLPSRSLSLPLSLPLSGGPSLSVSQDGCGCQTTQSRTFSSLYYTTKILTSSSLKNPYFQLVVLKPITNFSRLLSPISFIRRIGDKHPDPFISLSLSLLLHFLIGLLRTWVRFFRHGEFRIRVVDRPLAKKRFVSKNRALI